MKRRRLKAMLFQAQAGRCCYCGCAVDLAPQSWGRGGRTPPNFATIEHLRRRSDGGATTPDNVALACFECNTNRGDISWVEYKTLMAS